MHSVQDVNLYPEAVKTCLIAVLEAIEQRLPPSDRSPIVAEIGNHREELESAPPDVLHPDLKAHVERMHVLYREVVAFFEQMQGRRMH